MSVLKVNNIVLICFYFPIAFGIFGFQNYNRLRLEALRKITTSRMLIREKTIKQKLDHYNVSDDKTYLMRYFEGLGFWKEGGPVYLYINGESEADKVFIETGIVYELANETNGALFLSEHRYYGKSLPFKKMNTKNFRFLSSQQALADNANLLNQIKSLSKFKNSKVVVVGGSYPGNLAAWMRLYYSDLVDAAVASSAPVLAKANFFEYLDVVAADYRKYGTPGCYDKIKKMIDNLDRTFQTPAGIAKLKKEQQICKSTDLTKPKNKQLFFYSKATRYMGIAQYASPQTIKDDCIKNHRSKFLHPVPNKSFFERDMWREVDACYDYSFDDYVRSLKTTKEVYAWTYQTCNEFGYFPTTNSNNQPFKHIPLQFYYNMCTGLFGAEFGEKRVSDGVRKTNAQYGGKRPRVTKVVFVNGQIDPWYPLSVLRNLSATVPAYMIDKSSHVKDLDSDAPGDPKMLTETRKKVKKLIKKWIGIKTNDA